MIELTLKLLDSIQSFLKLRLVENRATFEDHIEPIYKDIKTIYEDYTKGFQSIREALVDPAISLDKIIIDLRSKQQAQKQLRYDIREYSSAFLEEDRFSKDLKTFCSMAQEIISTVPSNIVVPPRPHTTKMTSLLELLESWGDPEFREDWHPESTEDDFRSFVSSEIQDTLVALDTSWHRLIQSYFRLRVKCLRAA